MGLPIFVPLAYIVSLFLCLSLFSRVYRRRAAQRVAATQVSINAEGEHRPAMAIHAALKAVQEEIPSPAETDAWIVPRATLQASLLASAADSMQRMFTLKMDKQALQALLERGSLGDDAASMLETAEKDAQAELMSISHNASEHHQGWSKLIFDSAGEVIENYRARNIVLDIANQREKQTVATRNMGLAIPEPTITLPEIPPLVRPM
ncbi:Translocation protein S66 [Malassezia cuniculi]|uniref:Translocation protein S66 n=1 Tax=Malassezia cuniculi TaxID=948313 RepID=A0AAF0EW19_9BASI|nr:Translocation protein S66 [Malassezia cuniculi]